MKDVIAPEAPPKINFTEFNVRQEHGRPHFIRLHDSVVKRLERRLLDNPPSAPSESVGLLTGSIDGSAEAGDTCTIAVDDFQPVGDLEEGIRAWTPRAGSPQKIVGYYRTHSKADFTLDSTDRTLFERCFPRDSRLTLLVKPPAGNVGTAMFFLGENGQLLFDRATVEFPFNLRELGAEDGPTPAEPAPVAAQAVKSLSAAPIPAKPVLVATTKPAPVVPPKQGPAAKPTLAVAPKPAPVMVAKPVPAVASLPAAVVSAVPAPVSASPAAAPSVAEAKAAPTQAAARGSVMLKVAIASGVVIASVFGLSELRVFDHPSGQPAEEASRTDPAEAPATDPSPSDPAPTSPKPKQPVQSKPVVPKPLPASVKPSASPVRSAAQAKKSSSPLTPRTQPVLVAESTTSKPPAVPQQQTTQPASAPAQQRASTPSPATPPVVSERPSAPQTSAAPPVSTPPPSPKAAESIMPVTPPRAIRQFAPVLPENVRRSISGEMIVRLKVSVDVSGKVISAEPVAGSAPVPYALASTAIGAVKRWQFEPARRGSDNVPGDVVLSFTFRK
jgi:TonB family protein